MESDFLDFMFQPKDLITANRPLRLRLDYSDHISEDMLLPQRVYGAESICGGIEYRLLCVSARAQLPLKEMIALPAALDIVTDRGGLRSVCGIITEASAGDSDGGLASYQLVLRDILSIMEKRINTRVFRNKDEVEIVQLILNEWRLGNPIVGTCFKHEVGDFFDMHPYPKREFTMQHNESDAAFIRRLLKRRGIAWFFRADQSDGGSLYHTMVLFNRPDSLRENAAGTIRYHRDNATEQRDTITSWSAVRTLRPGSTARHSWDYLNTPGVHFMRVDAESSVDQGTSGNQMAASLDDYQVLPPHAGDDHEDLFKLGQLRMQRHDYEAKCFHGEGSVRDLCVGEYFALSEHPEIDSHPPEEREFAVTALQVTAQNNLPKALAARVERLFARNRWMREQTHDAQLQKEMSSQVADGPSRMHIQFTAVRRGIPIVPDYDPRTDLPQPQMQSAIVVGPENEEVYCDELGRVKIRCPGTREQDHQHAFGTGASDGENDSAWVRVASNWAGNGPGSQAQCGTLGLPRIGSEVLVAFLGGDPDKPIIVAQLFNQEGKPPALSNMGGLPGNKHLSGIKSREIQGGRANQLRFDDTRGQISAQLASDHADSQMNLGFLTQPRSDGEGTPRGEGAELRSNQALALRAANGILLSAAARPKDSQLDRKELLGMLDVLVNVADQLAVLAATHSSDDVDGQQLVQLAKKLNVWTPGVGTQAVIAASAPDGMAMISNENVVIGAKSKLDMICVDDAQIASGKNIFARAAHGLSLFAHRLGMKLVAASGNVVMQAHHGDINLTASGRIRITAGEGVEIQTPEVKIATKGAQANFGGGAITQQCSGAHTIKSASFAHTTGGSGSVSEVKFPSTKMETDERVILHHSQTGKPVAGRRYSLRLPDGSSIDGVTDEQGRTALATSDEMGDIEVVIYPEEETGE